MLSQTSVYLAIAGFILSGFVMFLASKFVFRTWKLAKVFKLFLIVSGLATVCAVVYGFSSSELNRWDAAFFSVASILGCTTYYTEFYKENQEH